MRYATPEQTAVGTPRFAPFLNTSFLGRSGAMTLAVIAASVIVLGLALSRSYYDGRLANPITHNDVNYFVSGIQYLVAVREHGIGVLLKKIIYDHAPVTTLQATLAFALFGIHDWAPYALNVVWVAIFFGYAIRLLRDWPDLVKIAILAMLIGMPISWTSIDELAPEVTTSLFTAIGAISTLRRPLLQASLKSRAISGLWFGLAYIAHPVAFAFTTIAVVGTIGLAFLDEVISRRSAREIIPVFGQCVLQFLLSIWLMIPLAIVNFRNYWGYFYDGMTNPIWRSHLQGSARFLHYINGGGGAYMFGNFAEWYPIIAFIGIIFSLALGARSFIFRIELAILAFVFWLVPSLSPAESALFALAFGFMVAFLIVLAIPAILNIGRGFGDIAVIVSALVLMFGVQSHIGIPNTPRSQTERELSFEAIERMRQVMVGNAVTASGVYVYFTSIGIYATNIVQYYVLRENPTFDWTFRMLWPDSNVDDQMKYIHDTRQDYVVAAQEGNGLTYQGSLAVAENPILSALQNDPQYMPLDRFFGSHGRTITVFQRRVAFAGWRPIWGVSEPVGEKDAPRTSVGAVTYLRTYAPNRVSAELDMRLKGSPGQAISISFNRKEIGKIVIDAQRIADFHAETNLESGSNDIILEYSQPTPVVFERLVVIPRITE